MNRNQALAKLERMVSADLPALSKNLFVRDGRTFYVFNQYEIRNQGDRWITIKHLRDPKTFGSLPSAVAWCIADRHHQHALALDIQRLDTHVTMLRDDIAARDGLRTRMRQQSMKDSVDVKVRHRQERLRTLNDDLSKSINRAKYLQIRGFNDETARTGRSASNR